MGEAERTPWVGHNYFVDRGRLCLETYDREGMPKTTFLANFQARITEEITRDDGLRKLTSFTPSTPIGGEGWGEGETSYLQSFFKSISVQS